MGRGVSSLDTRQLPGNPRTPICRARVLPRDTRRLAGTKTCCKAYSLQEGHHQSPPCPAIAKRLPALHHSCSREQPWALFWHSFSPSLFPFGGSLQLCKVHLTASVPVCSVPCLLQGGVTPRAGFVPSLQKLPWPSLHGMARQHPTFSSLGNLVADPSNRLEHLIWGLLAQWAGAVPRQRIATCPGASLLAAGRFMCSCPRPRRVTENNTKKTQKENPKADSSHLCLAGGRKG